MEAEWWAQFLAAAEWAWDRRFAVRGKKPDPSTPLSGADFAAGALADPVIADALEAGGVNLAALENGFVHAMGIALDPEELRRGSGGVAYRRGDSSVTIDHVWTYLLYLSDVRDNALIGGVYQKNDRWGISGWGAVRAGLAVALRYALPVSEAKREAILVADHDVVTRDFVFHLLREEAQLTAIAALRAIRRIEKAKEATVFVGTHAQVENRWLRMTGAIAESGSALRIRREPRW